MSILSFENLGEKIFGPARDPMNPDTRRHIVLVAFLGWVGLGADGLSSSCYGPEEAFLALKGHTHLALYLALATAATVFVISFAYNQVIELFPTGGGGYRVASKLIGPRAGLVAGSALVVDYFLTISISIASGVDALFSLFPEGIHFLKLATELSIAVGLIFLNLRGLKESIQVLLPIFLGFVFTHAVMIVYGVLSHGMHLPQMVSDTLEETRLISGQMGWTFVASTLLFAFSQGGGTYTGLEAVSNNVNQLAPPRVRTGKWTMFYIACSLSFTAGGIICLYLLWEVAPMPGQTLNAVAFGNILKNWNWGGVDVGHGMLIATLAFEAGLLFVAANTGFLGGPAVLANMAADRWVPHQFGYLSSRLVTRNGILLMGIAAIAVLWGTGGKVGLLVVLYSINVFITFTLSMLGMTIYWVRRRHKHEDWYRHAAVSGLGLLVAGSILVIIVYEKFSEGGWVTLLITAAVIGLCLLIRSHYESVRDQLKKLDELFAKLEESPPKKIPELDPRKPTAIILVGRHPGPGMHSLLNLQRLFPGHFKNYIFVSVGEVDSQSYGGDAALQTMTRELEDTLQFLVNFCHGNGFGAESYHEYGTDVIARLTELTDQLHAKYPNAVFFAAKIVFVQDNWFTNLLHNQTAMTMQRRLHLKGVNMVVLPMKV